MRYLALLSLLLITACSTNFKYLGDSYSPNNSDIDVFYDIGDINKEFKVMGILTANTEQSFDKSTEKVKNEMIEKAATKGADAILFINIYGTGGDGDDSHLESKLIKYK